MATPLRPTTDAYERLFHRATEHGLALLDGDGTVVDWNPMMARFTGVPAEQAIGRPYAWLHALTGGIDADTALTRARAGEPVTTGAWLKDESPRRWCDTTLTALPDPSGAVDAFAVITRDTTDAVQSPITRLESEDRFARALHRARVWVFHQDRELRYVWVPATLPGLESADPTLLIGHTDAELLEPHTAARLTAVKQRVLDRDEGERTEVTVVVDDRELIIDLAIEPLHDLDGAIVGLTCAAIDVTERHHTEDELRRSRAMLAEAERIAQMGSWEWDIPNDEIRWSDGLYDIYGLTPETLDPRWAGREQRLHPEDRARVEAAVDAAVAACSGLDMEYRIVRRDGRVRRLHVRAEVIVDDEGRPTRMAGTAQDVTEVRAAEEALEQTAAELGQRAAALHRITHQPPGVGHDVRRLLSERQFEILGLIAEGMGNAEIAGRLYLSEATVKWHVRQILRKLGVANRAEAVARYVRTLPAAR